MPSLVATTFVRTNKVKFSGHYVRPRTHNMRAHALRSHQNKEVVKVEKVFVDKAKTFFDSDNVRWNNCDIFLTTKEEADTWK